MCFAEAILIDTHNIHFYGELADSKTKAILTFSVLLKKKIRERGGLVVRASDSGARGRGFNPHSGRHVVSLSKIHLCTPPKYW